MTLGLVFKRMRREWRSLAILLLAVCLLTGFFALGPFYIRAVTEVGLRHELDIADPEERMISLIVDNESLTPDSYEVVRDELGDLAAGMEYYIRADYTAPTVAVGQNQNLGMATGGYMFQYGDPTTINSPRTENLYQPFGFDNMPDKLNLVEGRWPVRLPPPSEVAPTGVDEIDQERQVGRYSRGQVEIVVTTTVAEEVELELGSRIVLGDKRADNSGATAILVVVGIVEPKDPDDTFWIGNRNFLEGVLIEQGFMGDFRYDYGLATLTSSYSDWLRDVVPGSSYVYQITTNTDAIDADNIQSVNDRLKTLSNRLNAYHPGLSVLSGLMAILENYADDVSDTEGPIILLSGSVLIMMLYHLINTVALVLEQQGAEWSTLVSRGGNIRQLVTLQLLTVGLLGLIGLVAGPLLSIVFMKIMEHVGPLSDALGGRALGSTQIPRISLYLSAAAAAAAVFVLTSPSVPAARRSLLRLKQLVSRPPTRPAWARFLLDVVLLILGVTFMLRLYYLVGGDFGTLLNNLVAAPRDVVKLIADNLNETGGLNDPFNLLGPALVLTGAALLWLRIFPMLMDGLSHLVRNSRHLTTPLAIWNVARDPGHYAQLVLLLIGTLALGTASLGLSATRDHGAWKTAHAETGGGARVMVDPAYIDPNKVNWNEMDGVAASTQVMHALGDPGSSASTDVHVVGINPGDFPAEFTEMAEVVDTLQTIPAPVDPGLELPTQASQLTVQVYSTMPPVADEPLVSVQLVAYIQDQRGIRFSVPLSAPEMELEAAVPGSTSEAAGEELAPPTPVEEWLTFSGAVPDRGQKPYRLMRIGIRSQQANIEAFNHTIYIDRIATQDAFGTSEVLESFENTTNVWGEAQVENPYAGSWVSEASNQQRVRGVVPELVTGVLPEIDGPTTMVLPYQMGRVTGGQQREPSVVVNPPQTGRIPVVINSVFANTFRGRGSASSIADQPLQVGDERNIQLNMCLDPDGMMLLVGAAEGESVQRVCLGSVEIGYVVVGVVDEAPAFAQRERAGSGMDEARTIILNRPDPVMITRLDLIRPVINQIASSGTFFDANEVWLELPDRQPSDSLIKAVDKLEGVPRIKWAWDRYGEIQRDPLPSAVAGMLFAGFWISLALSLLDFAFYLAVTAKQRAFTFGVLRSLGWNASHIWRLLFVEQVVLILPALIIGSLIGSGLAYLLLPFMALVGNESLHVPVLSLVGLVLTLIVAFGILLAVAAIFLRRMSVNQVLRMEGE